MGYANESNAFKLNPGELRTPIKVQRVTLGKNEDNMPVNFLKDIISCRAKVTSYKGKQDLEAQGKVYIDEKKVIIRKPKFEILDTDVIVLNNKVYDITSIVNVDEKNRFYELKVRYSK